MSWTLTKKLDFLLRVQVRSRGGVVLDPGETKSREVELGSESWTCLLLQLFLSSSVTDIVTLLRTAV